MNLTPNHPHVLISIPPFKNDKQETKKGDLYSHHFAEKRAILRAFYTFVNWWGCIRSLVI